jgi:hypothetical protein
MPGEANMSVKKAERENNEYLVNEVPKHNSYKMYLRTINSEHKSFGL